MDPNSLQSLPGMAYINKLQSEQPSAQPFAEYDALTPDEPAPMWLAARQLIKRLITAVTTLTRQSSGRGDNVSRKLDRTTFVS